ncbi:MAG: FAD-dependent thymidylate synthase [Treponema sp.]|jgi:thymidylate synthase (FAD)|nr:FAD-dependent thymidylate synthase [Treponema sp.]
MRIEKQRHEVLYPKGTEWQRETELIELAGRTAYRSEDSIEPGSAQEFIRRMVKNSHLAVIEFGSMTVRFVTDRGITHELVRHRLCSFIQESTRYCNYGKDKFERQITVIQPSGLDDDMKYQIWESAMHTAEQKYLQMLDGGCTPQQARSVLPTCLKTVIVVKANFREWRHIFELRAINKAAHPDIRALLIPLYNECRGLLPEVFDI